MNTVYFSHGRRRSTGACKADEEPVTLEDAVKFPVATSVVLLLTFLLRYTAGASSKKD